MVYGTPSLEFIQFVSYEQFDAIYPSAPSNYTREHLALFLSCCVQAVNLTPR